jgi:hypothetical protein
VVAPCIFPSRSLAGRFERLPSDEPRAPVDWIEEDAAAVALLRRCSECTARGGAER